MAQVGKRKRGTETDREKKREEEREEREKVKKMRKVEGEGENTCTGRNQTGWKWPRKGEKLNRGKEKEVGRKEKKVSVMEGQETGGERRGTKKMQISQNLARDTPLRLYSGI